jgi:CHASE1-domain containing sensor protein
VPDSRDEEHGSIFGRYLLDRPRAGQEHGREEREVGADCHEQGRVPPPSPPDPREIRISGQHGLILMRPARAGQSFFRPGNRGFSRAGSQSGTLRNFLRLEVGEAYAAGAIVLRPRDPDGPVRSATTKQNTKRATAMVRAARTSAAANRRTPAVAIAVVGTALTVLACILASHREADRNQVVFDRRASVLAGAVARSFQLTREVVLSLPALFESSIAVEPKEFTSFVNPALQRHRSLAALEWAPLVKDEDRAEFEARIRSQGHPTFEFREPDAGGKMVRSGRRDVYLPLVYMEPSVEAVQGLELLFEPGRNVEIWAAIDQGTLHVSHRFKLVEDPEGVQSVAVYAPGYDRSRSQKNPAERRAALLGLGVALFRLQPLIDGALAGQMRDGIALALVDPAAPPDVRVLYETERGTVERAEGDSMTHREVFDFGNRHYTVLSVGRIAATWNQWLVLAIGLGLTLVATAGYLTLTTIGRLRRKLAESVYLGQYTLEAWGSSTGRRTRCCAGRRRSSSCRRRPPARATSPASSARCS